MISIRLLRKSFRSGAGDKFRRQIQPILIYLMLVGIPLLGIAETLRIGNTLEAPISIAGNWDIKPESSLALAHACAPLQFTREHAGMAVRQSGTFIQVQFNDTRQTALSGKLTGDTVNLRQVFVSDASINQRCGATTLVVLQLQYVSGDVEGLKGRWLMSECDSCPASNFDAFRQVVRNNRG